MRSIRTERFKSLYERLPDHVQREADEAYRRFKDDPSYPGLNFERLQGIQPPLYSVRIGRQYRALAGRDGDTWVWFWIGTHADYDHILERYR